MRHILRDYLTMHRARRFEAAGVPVSTGEELLRRWDGDARLSAEINPVRLKSGVEVAYAAPPAPFYPLVRSEP